MIIFRKIEENATINQLLEIARRSKSPLDARAGAVWIAKTLATSASSILEEAEAYSLSGDLWRNFLTLRLCEDDNVLGRAAELGASPSNSLTWLATGELATLYWAVETVRQMVESTDELFRFQVLANYEPSRRQSILLDESSREAVKTLGNDIAEAFISGNPQDAMDSLLSFYERNGSGIYALNRAFKWETAGAQPGLVPVRDLDPIRLEDLIGYQEQKADLLTNTELFVREGRANNLLLFGDSGTGKSSSVRALLNRPDLVRQGLRMIEVQKGCYRDLPAILNYIRGRNYRFILFMDDLSFEEFEVEYKYLKAVIEGGLERKPDNAVIYATSNRRNLVREVWADRKAAKDDVHGWDTMQEKHSLADRFGVTIWYGSVDKDRYLDLVLGLAEKEGLDLPRQELMETALRLAVGRGGYTGRTARQIIQYVRRTNGGDPR